MQFYKLQGKATKTSWLIRLHNDFTKQGVRNPGGPGGPGPPQYFGKNIHKFQKKGTLKFSTHYLGPLNNYRVAHALLWYMNNCNFFLLAS